jgi:DNA-binding response OmpR family regulator
MTSLLVIEDDSGVAARLVKGLRKEGFEVELATDGARGLELARTPRFDLVVLDLLLPELNGFELLRRLGDRGHTPVIVLSARDELEDRLRTFDLGAVDFVAKPFWLEELVVRIRTRLRLDEERPRETVRWADVEVDLDARRVLRDGAPVALTRAELDVLASLARRRGRAVARHHLASLALDDDVDPRTIDSHVARIRRKLGADAAAAIATVWGVGYRFEPHGAPDGAPDEEPDGRPDGEPT